MESGRGSSAPATVRAKAKASPNPFWDERHRDEFRLQQARPADLPALEEGAREVTQTTGDLLIRSPHGVAEPTGRTVQSSSSTTQAVIALPDGPVREVQEGNGGVGQLVLRHAQAPPRELSPSGVVSLELALPEAVGAVEVDLATPKGSSRSGWSRMARGEAASPGVPDSTGTGGQAAMLGGIRGLMESAACA